MEQEKTELSIVAGVLAALLVFPGSALPMDPSCHDPSRLVPEPGGFLLHCSGENGEPLTSLRVNSATSAWEAGAPVFAGGLPAWTSEVQIWNPTGEFDAPASSDPSRLYFTVFDEQGEQIQDAIGLADSTGTGASRQWEDGGIVLRSQGEGEHPRAMDPSVFEDDAGGAWMVFGSHAGGIYLVALNPATGLLLEHPEDPWADPTNGSHPDRFVHLASYGGSTADENAIEAPFIHYRNGNYYLFVNWDRCCSGTASDYNIRVGRATNVEGPYLDRAGVDMAVGGGTVVLDADGVQLGDDRYVGPGHAGITTIEGSDVFTFHYYDANDGGQSRVGAKILDWDTDGWPVVTSEDFVTDSSVGGDTEPLAKLKATALTQELGRQSLGFVTGIFPVVDQDFDPQIDAMQITLYSGEIAAWQGQLAAGDANWRGKNTKWKWRSAPEDVTGGLSLVLLAWKSGGEGRLKLRAKNAEINDNDIGPNIRVEIDFGAGPVNFVPGECRVQSDGGRLSCR